MESQSDVDLAKTPQNGSIGAIRSSLYSRALPYLTALRPWLNEVCKVGMAGWFVASLLYTFNPYPYEGHYYSQIPPGCAPVLCRAGTIWGGHTWVWLAIWGFGLLEGRLYRNYTLGFLLALMVGSSHEIFWNATATFVYGVNFWVLVSKYIGVFQFEVFDVITVAMILARKEIRQVIDKTRILYVLPIWITFMLLWWSIGFPVTLYGGQTMNFSDLQTNLIEINSWLIWVCGAIAVIKHPVR